MSSLAGTQVLRNEFKTIRGLFRQFEAINRRAHVMKKGVVREIFMMLEVDARLEEELLYPSIESSLDQAGKDLILEGEKSHRRLRALKGFLAKQDLDNEYFNSKFTELITTAEEHMLREEEDLFPSIEKNDRIDLNQLGMELQRRQAELIDSEEFSDSHPSLVQSPSGGERISREIKSRQRKAGLS